MNQVPSQAVQSHSVRQGRLTASGTVTKSSTNKLAAPGIRMSLADAQSAGMQIPFDDNEGPFWEQAAMAHLSQHLTVTFLLLNLCSICDTVKP